MSNSDDLSLLFSLKRMACRFVYAAFNAYQKVASA